LSDKDILQIGDNIRRSNITVIILAGLLEWKWAICNKIVYFIRFSSVVYTRIKIKRKFAAVHVMDTGGGDGIYNSTHSSSTLVGSGCSAYRPSPFIPW